MSIFCSVTVLENVTLPHTIPSLSLNCQDKDGDALTHSLTSGNPSVFDVAGTSSQRIKAQIHSFYYYLPKVRC